jgi:hypothetical protein
MVTVKTYTFTNVQADHTISAEFEAMTINISLANSGLVGKAKIRYKFGSGSWVNITNPTVAGTEVTVPSGNPTMTIEAYDIAAGYAFNQWQLWVPGQGPAVNDNPAEFNSTIVGTLTGIELNLTVRTPHTITASAGSNGTISPSGSVTVYDGDDQTFTVTADSGYKIKQILVDGSPIQL